LRLTMRAMPVVVVRAGKKMLMVLLGVLIEAGIGPFAKSRLNKSFGFTVGARGVRTGKVMAQAETQPQPREKRGSDRSDHCR
jgi:hypothetical protein